MNNSTMFREGLVANIQKELDHNRNQKDYFNKVINEVTLEKSK
jgi:hypothetical protein